MTEWRALLLVYRRIDVRLRRSWWRKERFVYGLTDAELNPALESFHAFPGLVEDLSCGEAGVTTEVRMVEEPLSSVTPEDGNFYWPSPDDTARELDAWAPAGAFDSVFALWPQTNSAFGSKVPCRGWGLGMGPDQWTNGATYAVVGNAPPWAWTIPVVGEVWLHEWLHGVCGFFADQGFAMPEYDADGGGSHGYAQSESTGWTSFYRDLMTGRVDEAGQQKGITPEAWRSGTPTSAVNRGRSLG